MTTQAIADRLVELCRQGEYMVAQKELYADDAVSIEPEGSPWKSEEGLEALHGKIELWAQIVEEIHSIEMSDPLVAGGFFSCKMEFDLTVKDQGRRKGQQIAVYQVRDGKIAMEHFFYTM